MTLFPETVHAFFGQAPKPSVRPTADKAFHISISGTPTACVAVLRQAVLGAPALSTSAASNSVENALRSLFRKVAYELARREEAQGEVVSRQNARLMSLSDPELRDHITGKPVLS